MADVEILQPVLNGGIKNASFTDGQLLTAEHLRTEQAANRAQHRQLGRAIGEGVADGFLVGIVSNSAVKPVLSVTPGLAFNRNGDALALGETSNVTLVKDASAAQANADAGLFAVCAPGKGQAVNTGLFLLTVQPASGYEGRIEMTELVSQISSVTCGRKFAVEGVQFRLVPLDLGSGSVARAQMASLTSPSGTPSPGLWVLRSGVAHLLYGTDRIGSRFGTDPFELADDGSSAFLGYGLLDELRAVNLLTSCEVPLAVVYWNALGVQFVDRWAVRRRPTPPLLGDPWPLLIDRRRVHESEAMLLQFQAQLDEIRGNDNPQTARALTHFRYLPAAGFLPITGPKPFGEVTFWTGLTVERLPLDRAFVRDILHESWFVDPIDLASPPPLKLYQVEDPPGYLLFFRDDVIPQAAPAPAPQPPSPGPVAKDPGSIFVQVQISDPKIIQLIGKLDPSDVTVSAVDEDKKSHPGKPYAPKKKGKIPSGGSQPASGLLEADFLISKLPPGPYTVLATVAKQKQRGRAATVDSNKIVTVTFQLKPPVKRPSGKGDVNIGKVEHPWWEKMQPIEKQFKWPWPPPEWKGRPYEAVNPAPDDAWRYQDLGESLARQHPEAPVDADDIQVYIAKDHTPVDVAADPYAYLAFGNGAYVPVVLIPTGKDLGIPVPVTRGEVGGLDEATHGASLRDGGVNSLDVLAYAWTGLVEETLGVGAATAQAMIGDARKQTAGFQNSLRLFAGVDQTLAGNLQELAQIADAKDLANADPDALAEKLGASKISPAFARRLVDDARNAVPSSEWSLGSPQLGFTEIQIAALEKAGITTRGALETAKNATLRQALGISTAEATALIQRSKATRAEAANSRQAKAPVTEIMGINHDSGLELANLGIHQVVELANMQPEKIALAFGGNIESAKAAIGAAQARLTR